VNPRRFAVAMLAGALALSGCTFVERTDVPAAGGARVAGTTTADGLSADGRFATFTSTAPLVAGDANGVQDVYLRDHAADATERISVAAGGGDADGPSSVSAISADGRYVLFRSGAQNLLAGETPDGANLFLRDRTAGTTARVPVTFDGEAPNQPLGNTELSANGRVVLFDTSAGNILEDEVPAHVNVYVHELDTGTTEMVSVSSTGEPADLAANMSGISGDGDLVVFGSGARNLGVENPSLNQVYLRRRTAHTTELVSATPTGQPAIGGANQGRDAITADGRFVLFTSSATNLTGSGPSSLTPFVRDLQTGTLTRVVPTAGEPLPIALVGTAMSEDGRFLLAGGLTATSVVQIFLIDRRDGSMRLAASNPAQQRLPAGSLPGAISADGSYVLFTTADSSLVGPGDPSTRNGAFLRSAVVPTLSAAAPSTATRGSTVDVTLTGTYLFTDPFVSFEGDGVSVTNVAVLDEEHVRVTVQVAPDAPVGKRTALLQNQGTGAGPRSGGLTVLVDALTVT
jgi:Tol biopolymer transport system component